MLGGRRKVRREEGEGRRDARQLPPFTPFLFPALNLNTVTVAVHELWGSCWTRKGAAVLSTEDEGREEDGPRSSGPHTETYLPLPFILFRM